MRYVIGALLLLALVGACGTLPASSPRVGNGDFSEQDVTLQDGRVVHCLFWGSGQGTQTAIGGMSCDWAEAK